MRVFRVLVAGLALALTTGPALARDSVRLVTGNDYKPFTDESLPEGGFMTAVVTAALDRASIRHEVVFQPWKRGYAQTASAEFDATFPYFHTEERAAEMLYSDPIYTAASKAFYLKDKQEISAPDDLKGLTMCSPVGYAVPPMMLKMLEAGSIEKNQPKDMQTCFRLLSAARVDFAVTNIIQGWDLVDKLDALPRDKVAVSPYDVVVNDLHFIVSRSLPDAQGLVDAFNEGLGAIRADGTFAAIEQRYMGQYLTN